MPSTSIAVIGAGFSGTLLSLHLLRQCPESTRVILLERNSQFGRGPAYSTGNASHLLNVPAGRMSAFHDRPTHFLEWLRSLSPEELDSPTPTASSFVPRRLFGDYVRSLLNTEIRREPRGRLELVRADVLALDRSQGRLRLMLDRGRTVDADLAVLAVGNFPPAPMPVADMSFYDSPLYRPDPWAADTLTNLDPTAPVLLIGTGLTMVDVVISLLDQGHVGPIYALSRRGLLPRRHADHPASDALEPADFPIHVTPLLRLLRERARHALARGGSWQPVVDELRPFMQDVWQSMPAPDRARFLRHMRPWWDVHRHRIPGAVADRVDAARQQARLRICAGRIQRYEPHGQSVNVVYRLRALDSLASISAARVINCSGPGADYDRIGDPLVTSLLVDGSIRPDPLKLGLDVTPTCSLLHRAGTISRRLFAVGPMTKGAFWEMTAVPDIRRQCEILAQHISSKVKASPAAPLHAGKACQRAGLSIGTQRGSARVDS